MYRPLAPLNLEPARYTCYRAAGPIVVDGKLDEPSWRLAPKSTPFVDIVTGEPAWFDTRVALLWDDDNLYFGFWVEETDVWGTLTERDSKICEENDVEVFIGGRDAYYEFEINALNTVYEVFWIWKDVHQARLPATTAGRSSTRQRSARWCWMASADTSIRAANDGASWIGIFQGCGPRYT